MADDKEKSDVAPKSARQPIKDWSTSEHPREKLLQLGPEGQNRLFAERATTIVEKMILGLRHVEDI